jgi:ComF family protein
MRTTWTLPRLLQGAIDLAIPVTCWMCREPAPDRASAFCAACEKSLTTDPDPVCPRCASSLAPATAAAGICPRCANENNAYDAVVRLGPYAGLLREAVLRMKKPHGEPFAEAFSALVAPHLRDRLQGHKADLVIPVPLHWMRRMRRGYNQSELLARALAAMLRLPLSTRVLRRTKHLKDQKELLPEERRSNVRGAFAPRRPGRPLQGRSVFLVDDVLTTGATAHEAARALQTLGARTVVIVLAHESPRK